MIKGGIPVMKIEAGNNYDFGFKLGKALRERINARLEKNKEFYRKKSYNYHGFKRFVRTASKFLPETKKRFPYLIEEAKGMAEGAGIQFEELFVLMCDEEFIEFKVYPLHCTSVAIKTRDNKILIGHNEDRFPEYRKNGLVLVKGKIKKTNGLCSPRGIPAKVNIKNIDYN